MHRKLESHERFLGVANDVSITKWWSCQFLGVEQFHLELQSFSTFYSIHVCQPVYRCTPTLKVTAQSRKAYPPKICDLF